MDVKQAYNLWANQYDTNNNKARDLEAISLRAMLENIEFENCLEIGCGTGKNTEWLATKAKQVTAIDLSDEMLAKARAKINAGNVQFYQADITGDWDFAGSQYDLITFSLVLEHIENLDAIFKKAAHAITTGGYMYVGELHPFKQYAGTKARFDTEEGQQIITCFDHNISDFTGAAQNNGFEIAAIDEHFDDNNKTTLPRILTLLLRKK